MALTLSQTHNLLSLSRSLSLFLACTRRDIRRNNRTGHTRGNSPCSVSNLPRLSNRALEGGYPRAACGETHQVSRRRSPFPLECNSICVFCFVMHSGGLSNFLYYVSLPDLDDFDEQQLLEVEQQQQQLANVNASSGKHVIAESTFAKNSKIFGATDDDETSCSSASSPATEVASATNVVGDDDDDAALSAKQANKRRRFDSDSGDSSLLRRLHTPKQEPREVGRHHTTPPTQKKIEI